MKVIIAVLLLTIGAFAQNTSYKDRNDWYCDSIMTVYGDRGELLAEYCKNNNETSEYRMLYESGQIEEIGTLEIGNSACIQWLRNNHIKFYKTGMIKSNRTKLTGQCVQIDTWYFENGSLAGMATYKNGKLVGYKNCTDGRFGNESLDCLN